MIYPGIPYLNTTFFFSFHKRNKITMIDDGKNGINGGDEYILLSIRFSTISTRSKENLIEILKMCYCQNNYLYC